MKYTKDKIKRWILHLLVEKKFNCWIIFAANVIEYEKQMN